MKKTLTILTAGIMLLSRTVPAQGQDAATPPHHKHSAAIEMNLIRSLWYNSENAAGMTVDTLQNYNMVSGAFDRTSGSLKSLQRGDRETSGKFNTNGARRIGRISLWGDFTFKNDYWTGTQYNTNRFFPSLDMPYYVADPNKGDWNKQLYDMTVKAAFPDCALLPRAGAPENEFAFLTPSMTRSALDSQLAGLKPCSVFRVLD